MSTLKIKEKDLWDKIIKNFYEFRNKQRLWTIDEKTSKLLAIYVRSYVSFEIEENIY